MLDRCWLTYRPAQVCEGEQCEFRAEPHFASFCFRIQVDESSSATFDPEDWTGLDLTDAADWIVTSRLLLGCGCIFV